MNSQVFVYDPTVADERSRVRGIGRYLQILKENFPDWQFTSNVILERSDRIFLADSISRHSAPPSRMTDQVLFINPFINFLQRPFVTKRIAQKQIAVIHDLIPLKYPEHFPVGIRGKLHIWTNKLALKNYDLIVTVSEASKRDIVNILGIREEKIQVIYSCLPKVFVNPPNVIASPSNVISNEVRNLGINSAKQSKNEIAASIRRYAGSPRNDKSVNYCLYVGDVTWNKNVANIAKAIKMADITCVFVGKAFTFLCHPEPERSEGEGSPPAGRAGLANASSNKLRDSSVASLPRNDKGGWLKEFNEFIKLTHGDKRFIFPGFVADEDLLSLYHNAACNIFVSRDEGFGFSYLEAASQTCPSILADIPVFHETARDAALFADPHSPKNIATQIKKLVGNPSQRKDLGGKAQKRADFFSSKNFVLGWQKALGI